jgi:hypothetical protein
MKRTEYLTDRTDNEQDFGTTKAFKGNTDLEAKKNKRRSASQVKK